MESVRIANSNLLIPISYSGFKGTSPSIPKVLNISLVYTRKQFCLLQPQSEFKSLSIRHPVQRFSQPTEGALGGGVEGRGFDEVTCF